MQSRQRAVEARPLVEFFSEAGVSSATASGRFSDRIEVSELHVEPVAAHCAIDEPQTQRPVLCRINAFLARIASALCFVRIANPHQCGETRYGPPR